jgi:large subunit ribosomal protein L25
MSDRINLVVESRQPADERAKNLRKAGWIPGVIYGGGENMHIKVENLSLSRVLRDAGMTNLIDISIGDGQHTVLAKDIQKHPTRGDLIHVDFYEVDMTQKLVVDAALSTFGEAPPVTDGLGTTSLVIYSIQIECLPDSLISEIGVDLTLIQEPDDMIIVGDLQVPEGVTVLTDSEAIVARFEYVQIEEEEEEEEEDLMFAPAADEVEVIGRGKPEDEEEIEE